jgi:quercetin dioxygenase-like cupin family protein
MNEFFNEIGTEQQGSKVIIKQEASYQVFEKEAAKGFLYKRVLTHSVKNYPVDIVILELKKGARRTQMVKTDAYEYKYIIQGKVEYQVENEKYILNTGDSLFFDGRLGHKPANIGDEDAKILVVYFFLEGDN